jgi:peptidyl-prolyl isomerase D
LKFEVELFDFDEPADTTPKKLELAMNAKAAGNDAFKTSEFQKAVADYQKGLKYLDDIYDLTEAEQAEKLRPLQQSLYLNLAACQLKLKDAKDAALNCHKALELDQNNVKAMFRLGQAYAMLGEFEKASVELKRAKELAPGDISIQKELVAVHKSQEAYRQKERNMFSKMFS